MGRKILFSALSSSRPSPEKGTNAITDKLGNRDDCDASAMTHHTIEAYHEPADHWRWLTFDGQPAPTLWRRSVSRWFVHRRGHSFSVYAPYDDLSIGMASIMVDRFFEPSTDRESVDLSIFDYFPSGRHNGTKKRFQRGT